MRRILIMAGLLLVAGCGHTKSTTTRACTHAGGTGVKSNPTRPSKTMLLTGVKVDSDSCSDRVIFDFRRDIAQKPAFRAEYRPAKEAQTEDASGRHLPIAGKAFLVVRFDPASGADLSGAKVVRTYKGPRRLKPHGLRFVAKSSRPATSRPSSPGRSGSPSDAPSPSGAPARRRAWRSSSAEQLGPGMRIQVARLRVREPEPTQLVHREDGAEAAPKSCRDEAAVTLHALLWNQRRGAPLEH
jgi:hypothetical protein